MAGGGFDATFDERPMTSGQVPDQPTAMVVAKFSRNQEVGQLSTEEHLIGLAMQGLWIVGLTAVVMIGFRFAVKRFSSVGG